MLYGSLGLLTVVARALALCRLVQPLQALQLSNEGERPHADYDGNGTGLRAGLTDQRFFTSSGSRTTAESSLIRNRMSLRSLYSRDLPSSHGIFTDPWPFGTKIFGKAVSRDITQGAQSAKHFLSKFINPVFTSSSSKEEGDDVEASPSDCPSMFVVVVSGQSNKERRNEVRHLWRRADQGWGKLKAKFAVCVSGGITDDLRAEGEEFGDVLFLDCEEGYLNGRLTLKVISSMRAYLDNYHNYDLFFKTDDDTFVSTRRLCGFFKWRKDNGRDNMNAYFGVFAEGPHENMFSLHKVNRDPESPWFETEEDYPFEDYPASAKGGPGYILPKLYVEHIIHDAIADKNLLRNEDKAVGVWVDRLAKRGLPVEYVNLPGTDGYDEHAESTVTHGPYKGYPHVLHHHLPGDSIRCLNRIDREANPELQVDNCFHHDVTRK